MNERLLKLYVSIVLFAIGIYYLYCVPSFWQTSNNST